MSHLGLSLVIFVSLSTLVLSYSKYGRNCNDIGCLNSEVCVMVEDPCSYHGSKDCGKYPTCKPAGSGQLTCANLDCPNGQQCTIDGSGPKCTLSKSTSTNIHPSHSDNAPSNGGGSGGHYPGLYPGGTTSRPYVGGGYSGGSGYQGGQPGSGYPGGSPGSGYPGSSSYPKLPTNTGSNYPGYPSQSGGYPGYPSGGNSGYPSQGSGYPGQYNNGYSNGYPGYQGGQSNNQGYGNNNNYGSRYGSNYGQNPQKGDSSGSLTDKITEGLKVFAGNYLKTALAKAIQGH